MQGYLFYIEKNVYDTGQAGQEETRQDAEDSEGVGRGFARRRRLAYVRPLRHAPRRQALGIGKPPLQARRALFYPDDGALSYSYDFCALHRMFCIYDFLVSLCIWWQLEVGFGPLLPAARIIMLIFGAILFAELHEHGVKKFLGC